MRIIGLSCGRRNGNNELLLKHAMTQARAVSGAELEIIRLQDLELKDCIGCETCMRGLTTGGDGLCVVRADDNQRQQNSQAQPEFMSSGPME